MLVSLLILGGGVRALAGPRPGLARHLLVWGLTVLMIATLFLLSEPWLPFLGLLLVFSAAMLISGGGVATAAVIAFAATWLTYSQGRVYPLSGLFMALVLGVALTWLLVSTLYTALQWTWNMNQRANRLLRVVSDQQVELKRTVKSLEQVNALQRRTQYELVLARKRAEEARRVTEQFAANISHELRTPLDLILGFSEMMQLSPEVYGEMRWPPKLRQAVYQIYHSSRHLMGLIDDILDLSRFDVGGEALNYESTPLGPLLRGTVGIVEDLFQGHQVCLEVDIPDNLPTLNIDRTRIRQELLNLLNNARRFTEQGVVRLEVKQGDSEIVISVSDTGPGIPADKLADIIYPNYGFWKELFSEEELNHIRALYMAEASMVDHWFGVLLDKIDELGLTEDTTVTFTSDHGYLFGEHDLTGKSLFPEANGKIFYEAIPMYDQVRRIPLMVRLPGQTEGDNISALVQAPDLMPTILEMAGLVATETIGGRSEIQALQCGVFYTEDWEFKPEAIHGRSLMPLMRGETDRLRDIVVSSNTLVHHTPILARCAIVTDDGWCLHYAGSYDETGVEGGLFTLKLINPEGARIPPDPELYHLPSDPQESNDVIRENEALAQDIHERYVKWLEEVGTPEEHLAGRRCLR